ncbi:MAG: exodeoxyribonuclease V subunit alpha [Gammaproteobacteria bacterium]|nr:MAG: exodeoxyribonuclease V subunit alpha [Gammaproteobacteria bacterium]
MDLLNQIEKLADNGDIRYIDLHFLRFLKTIEPEVRDDVLLAALLVNNNLGKGDVCVDLNEQSESLIVENSIDVKLNTPPLQQWLEALNESALVSTNGRSAPLRLVDNNYLFLTRYWDYELRLASDVNKFASSRPKVDLEQLKHGVGHYFPKTGDETDWQMVAAVSALMNRFTVITGGPGTGKTTTVAKILALFAEQHSNVEKKIVLAAPTGKAANRLTESINNAKNELDLDMSIQQRIPDIVLTLHRLLGASPYKSECRYNATNKIDLDLLVVDEASMIDLAMMSKLMQAMPEQAQIIFLGDMNQLASVESGSVLADICVTGMQSRFSEERRQIFTDEFGINLKDFGFEGNGLEEAWPLQDHVLGDCVVSLKKSYRFTENSGIGCLARATNEKRPDDFISAFNNDRYKDIFWRNTGASNLKALVDSINLDYYRAYLKAETPKQALELLSKFQVLSPIRDGVFGIYNLNRLIQDRLQRSGLINTTSRYYHGQPIMITENDYRIGLYNGDIGIILSDSGQLKAYFPDVNSDAISGAGGGVKRFLLAKLPAFETVFAMTVHKSQGSEFDNVLVVLPEQYAEYMSKELLYTAITRARKSVEIWGGKDVIKSTIETKITRNSLLQQQLI